MSFSGNLPYVSTSLITSFEGQAKKWRDLARFKAMKNTCSTIYGKAFSEINNNNKKNKKNVKGKEEKQQVPLLLVSKELSLNVNG